MLIFHNPQLYLTYIPVCMLIPYFLDVFCYSGVHNIVVVVAICEACLLTMFSILLTSAFMFLSTSTYPVMLSYKPHFNMYICASSG